MNKNQEAWEEVQRQVQEERRQRELTRSSLAQPDQKSLYEVLQENKAAKEAEIAERNRLQNQFRPLDDDDARFLEEVNASKRAEEARIRQQTEAELALFRQAQKGYHQPSVIASTTTPQSSSTTTSRPKDDAGTDDISVARPADGDIKEEQEQLEIAWSVKARKRKRPARDGELIKRGIRPRHTEPKEEIKLMANGTTTEDQNPEATKSSSSEEESPDPTNTTDPSDTKHPSPGSKSSSTSSSTATVMAGSIVSTASSNEPDTVNLTSVTPPKSKPNLASLVTYDSDSE